MNPKVIETLFCCVLLSSRTLTDAYALSQHAGIKRHKADASSQVLVAKKHLKHETRVVHDNEITNDKFFIKTQPPEMAQVHATRKPKVLEIKEVNHMHQQHTKENIKDLNHEREQQLLKHIEKQIQIRLKQQGQRQRQNRNVSGQTKHERIGRNVQQVFNPKQSYAAARSNSDQHHSALQNLSRQRVAQRRVRHSIMPQTKPQQSFERSDHVQLETRVNKQLLHQSRQQQNNILSANQIQIPHGARQVVYPPNFIRRGPVTENTHQLNSTLVQQVPSQHTNILIPVSALSSNHILNGQGLLQNKIFLVNPMSSNNAFHVVSNGDKSRAAPTTQLPKPLPTTTKTTTTSTTTTELPPTTVSTTSTTFTSVQESTTATNMKKIKQKFMEITMKKQELEIIKLRLEIRALRREERNSLPEVENDDDPQRRGNIWQGQSMFPFFG